MFSPINNNASLENRIKTYLRESYYTGYDLDPYFTENNQIMMFEKLLKCDEEFKREWESGSYCEPTIPSETMYLSPYITKQSYTKKIFRKCSSYKINNKLTKGAKNLLKGYMIKYSQNEEMNNDEKIEQMFCGILRQANERRISQIGLPNDLLREISSYEEKRKYGGKTSKRRFKIKNIVNKNKTNKTNKRKNNKRRTLKVYNNY